MIERPDTAIRKLRRLIVAFVVVLALPLGWLVLQVNEKIENEVFYQYQQSADDVVNQINSRIEKIVRVESERPFDDYTLARSIPLPNGEGVRVELSPLAQFPLINSVPGMIGYFQVDPDGSLRSPLVPSGKADEPDLKATGITASELAERFKAYDSLSQEIVAAGFGEQKPVQLTPLVTPSSKQQSASEHSERREDEVGGSAYESTGYLSKYDLGFSTRRSRRAAASSSAAQELNAPAAERPAAAARGVAAPAAESAAAYKNEQQVADTLLQNRAQTQQLRQDLLLENRSGVRILEQNIASSTLNLDSKLLERRLIAKSAEAKEKVAAKKSLAEVVERPEVRSKARAIAEENLIAESEADFGPLAKDQGEAGALDGIAPTAGSAEPAFGKREANSVPEDKVSASNSVANAVSDSLYRDRDSKGSEGGEGNLNQTTSTLGKGGKSPKAIKVLSPESERDPFLLRVINDTRLLLIRKVWQGGQRYLQGIALNSEVAFKDLLAEPFRSSSISEWSTMIVGYRGVFFHRVEGGEAAKVARQASDREIVLARKTLAPPFDEIEVLITAAVLPESSGKGIITIFSLVTAGIILLGLFSIYRLGARQILLAKERSDFVSAVSHELKTPLTSIRMYGDMLRSGWVVDEAKRNTYYDYIVTESERLSRLIANVLHLSSLANADTKLALKAVPAERLLSLAKEKVSSQVESAGFKLTTNFEDLRNGSSLEEPKESLVSIEEDGFSRIAINLVDNALKFSAAAEQKEIVLTVRVAERRVTFSVRDFGPGVPRDEMKRIFRLFYRAEDELRRNTPGTGIGLALVQELALRMRAEVDLKNREPGAEFLVSWEAVAS